MPYTGSNACGRKPAGAKASMNRCRVPARIGSAPHMAVVMVDRFRAARSSGLLWSIVSW